MLRELIKPGTARVVNGKRVERHLQLDLFKMGDGHWMPPEMIEIEQNADLPQPPTPDPAVPDEPIYPSDVRGLSIQGCFAWLIAKGYKAEEYRNWDTSYRGWVMLHVTKSHGMYSGTWEQFGVPKHVCPDSSIVGIGKLVGVESYPDGYGHVFDNVIALPEPIRPVSGARNYWKPKDTQTIRAFNRAWRLAGL